MEIRAGQVWLYQRTDRPDVAPVVHVITKVENGVCESTSVFTDDGTPHLKCVLSGEGTRGIGLKHMADGRDAVGTWTLLYSKVYM